VRLVGLQIPKTTVKEITRLFDCAWHRAETSNEIFQSVIGGKESLELTVTPDVYQPYQETAEDLLHEIRLRELEAEINEKPSAADDELGELPYDAEADRKIWDELEREFDRVFDEAKKL
jgi:hypothetical protein